jgi:formate/nitrite transporter FocA (FNT family)
MIETRQPAAAETEPEPAGEGGAELDQEENKKAEELSASSARIVHQAIRKEGEEELERPVSALAWSGLAAGLSMGFSFIAEALLQSHLPDTPWRPLISKLGYTLGFVIVVLGRQQLFTENTLTPILPLMAKPQARVFGQVARLWAVVLAFNLLGALAIATVIARTALFEPDMHAAFADIGRHPLSGGFGLTVLRGIFAGWLIALMVWLLPLAEAARLWVIILLTYFVSLGGFTHIVAGSIDTFYLVAAGQATWGEYFGDFALPTLIGNVLGGVTLVAAVNHAQVVAGK